MTLGEYIKMYIDEHNMTYEDFAQRSKISKGYVSMLVNNANPKTKKPPKPKIQTYINIASAMGLTIDDLFDSIDDSPVKNNSGVQKTLNAIGEALMIKNIREIDIVTGCMAQLPKDLCERIVGYAQAITDEYRRQNNPK